jgi:dynein heavy chain
MNELKSLKNPPQAIKLLMEGVCIALGVEPMRTKAKDGATILKDYWPVATGKAVLGNPRLVEILS